jgi:hypothetical protein
VRATAAKTFREMATDLSPVVNSELPNIDQEARFPFRSFHSSFEFGVRPSNEGALDLAFSQTRPAQHAVAARRSL